MKKHLLLFLAAILLCSGNIQAQVLANTCGTPIGFSSSAPYTYSALTATPNTDVSNNYGCIAPANNATWFYFQACTGGTANLMFTNLSSSSADVDMIAWGPLAAPTDCGLAASQILDCSNAIRISGSDTLTFPVVSGSYYKFLVANTSNTFESYQLMSWGATLEPSCPACPGLPFIQDICQVTTDPVLNKNIIIWEKDSSYLYDYVIQKETTTMGVYATLGTVINSDTSIYVDSVSNPMIQAFRYRIVTTDSCANMNIGGDHQTIHLLTSISSSTGYPQLSWSSYYGFSYGTYWIYRGSSPATLTLYDSISASFNSYTDVAAVPGMNYYSVAVMPPSPCQPSRSMSMPSMSNCAPVMFTGINEYEFNGLTLGPNPASNMLNFSLGTASDVQIDLVDVTGRMVLSKAFKNVSSDMIDLSQLANGSYVVRFTSEKRSTYRNIIVAR